MGSPPRLARPLLARPECPPGRGSLTGHPKSYQVPSAIPPLSLPPLVPPPVLAIPQVPPSSPDPLGKKVPIRFLSFLINPQPLTLPLPVSVLPSRAYQTSALTVPATSPSACVTQVRGLGRLAPIIYYAPGMFRAPWAARYKKAQP